MRTKNKSYHEIKINGFTIGFAVSLYYYYSSGYNLITTELIPYPTTLYNVPTLEFNDLWPVYIENPLRSLKQEESQIKDLLNQMFSNLESHTVEIINQREGYNLQLKIGDKIQNGFLVYERQLQPNFKQVQLFPNNEIYQFGIDRPDSEIYIEIVDILMNK